LNSKVANFLSIIGHPLLTVPLIIEFVLLQNFQFSEIILESSLLFGIIILTVANNLYKLKKKSYSNFDVSNQNQRKNFYLYLLIVLIIFLLIDNFLIENSKISVGLWISFSMVVCFAIINYFIKSSLHTGVNLFLTCILFSQNIGLAFIFLVLTFLVAYSRLILKKHSLKEIISGGIIGLIFGLIYLILN